MASMLAPSATSALLATTSLFPVAMSACPARLVSSSSGLRPMITLRPWIASHACMVHARRCPSRHPHRLTLHPRASLRTNSLSTGTYSLAAGSTNCTRCAAGTASADAALSTACPSCPANTYAQYVGSTVCL